MSVTRTPPRELSDRMICGLFVLPTLSILLLMVAYPFISLLYYSSLAFSVLRPMQPAKSHGLA